jgi:hypothetical protein
MQKVVVQPPRDALAAARARLFSAALRALDRGALPTEQAIRVRRALKAGRSRRCSDEAIDYAARRCNLLARDLDRRVGTKPPHAPVFARGEVVPR